MTTESTPSPLAADVQALQSEMKILQEIIARIQQRLDQIEDELTALRNLF
jgi:prefoldin subunit 5